MTSREARWAVPGATENSERQSRSKLARHAKRGPPAALRVFALALALLAWLTIATIAGAKEPYQEFLNALRERQMYDIALYYLESMRTSPLVSDEDKEVMPYEEAVTLVGAARVERETVSRNKLLDRARDKFQQFIDTKADHPMALVARRELGQVLVERGKGLLSSAARPANAANRENMQAEARALFTQATPIFEDAEVKFKERLGEFPRVMDPEDPQKKEKSKVENEYFTAQNYAAGILQEAARSYPTDAPQRAELLKKAGEKYGKIYETYRDKVMGLHAQVKQGECLLDLGDSKQALGIFRQILAQPDQDALRRIKAIALRLQLKILTSETEKKYVEAIKEGQAWIDQAQPAETRREDGLGIRYYTALAMKSRSETLPPEEERDKPELIAGARRNASFVARAPSPYSEDAKKLRDSLGGKLAQGSKEPTDFVEAKARGQEAMDAFEALLANQAAIESSGKTEEIAKWKENAHDAQLQAIRYLKLAITLRDESSSLDDLNITRNMLCRVYFMMGRYFEAAVIGEFLETNYPQSPGAKTAAQFALYSYVKGIEETGPGKGEFERAKMTKIAGDITKRWPGEPLADEAWSVLMQFAFLDHDVAKGLEYLAKIGPDSLKRGDAELLAGKALRAEYQRALGAESSQRPPQADLDRWLATAFDLLKQGIERARVAVDAGKEIDSGLLQAAFQLADMYLTQGQVDQAVALLDDKRIGPMALAIARGPLFRSLPVRIEAYTLGLRAYVAASRLDQAEQVMNDLEAMVAENKDEKSAATLTRVYVALGRQLEAQIKQLQEQKKTDDLQRVSKSFDSFLDRISARPDNSVGSLKWVAATYSSLASGFVSPGQPISPKAQEYCEKAIVNYRKILDMPSEKSGLSPEQGLGLKLQMAICYRRVEKFNDAIQTLESVLTERPLALEAQKEAALTYQDRGAKKADYYELAISGARKRKTADNREENLIWGWATLAKRAKEALRRPAPAGTNPQQYQRGMRELFHESRLNLAKCRLKYAIAQPSESQGPLLASAANEIKMTRLMAPDLGGPDWLGQYDELYRQIQRAERKEPTGLPPLAPPKSN